MPHVATSAALALSACSERWYVQAPVRVAPGTNAHCRILEGPCEGSVQAGGEGVGAPYWLRDEIGLLEGAGMPSIRCPLC